MELQGQKEFQPVYMCSDSLKAGMIHNTRYKIEHQQFLSIISKKDYAENSLRMSCYSVGIKDNFIILKVGNTGYRDNTYFS
ncbi:hypothetical protein VIGAN_11112000 [Vigna angularis var. angularis]|uniref:Uncharacterized protein n=1 Tax=Vigna angularis var. angularis TaxID=157739 RepID=A0A0S3T9A5_PHAAN|nr:hypothetical protein VIGAN_11112000 [Vigna angularis var. angularis]